jgi:hypothetical protein
MPFRSVRPPPDARYSVLFFLGGKSVMRRAVVVIAMSAVALAGCGSSGGGGNPSATGNGVLDPSALVAASYSKITAAKTAKVDVSFSLTQGQQSGGSGTDLHFSGTGGLNFGDKAGDLTLDLPDDGQLQERILGTVIYEKLPASEAGTSPLLKGKWLKIDLNKAAQQQGLSSAGNMGPSDPSQIFHMLTSVSNGVTKVGDEKVRGVDTTHYRAVVDLGKVGAQQGYSPADVAKLKQLMGTSSYPVDVWIDKDGLPRRVQFDQPVPTTSAAGLKGARMIATEEFYDFGTPVSVQAPPADQTVDASKITGGTSGSAGQPTHA